MACIWNDRERGRMADQQILTFVEKEYGKDILSYLKNKNTGGAAGNKGILYENLYAVYQLARMVRDTANDNLYISTQTLNFVDDLIIEDKNTDSKRHYQLKKQQEGHLGRDS